MARGDPRDRAAFVEIGPKPETQRLDAEQVDFLPEQPARVIFAKAVRRDERLGLILIGVGLQVGTRQGHGVLRKEWRGAPEPYINAGLRSKVLSPVAQADRP